MPSSPTNATVALTLGQIGRLLLRRWLVIALSTVLAAAAAFGLAATRTPLYTATATEYFGIATGNSAAELSLGSKYLQDQMPSYGELATSPVVLNPVIDTLGLTTTAKQLARQVEVTTPRNTVVMRIDVVDSNPDRAASIANAVGRQLTTIVGSVAPKLSNGRALVVVQSIQAALPPTVQSSPNKRRDAALGLLAGLLLSCGAVIATSRLDRTLKTPAAVGEVTEVPLVGTVRTNGAMASGQLVIPGSTKAGASADDIRRLRAAVEQLAADRGGLVVAVTSAVDLEGRSTVAANLAAALTEAGEVCVLVDADLSGPALASLTGADPDRGLADALNHPGQSADLVQHARGIAVVPAGETSGNAKAVLSSPAFDAVLRQLRSSYRFVVLDMPALLTSADTTDLGHRVDGLLVVANARRSRRDQLVSALRAAEVAGVAVLGVVLNDVRQQDMPSLRSARGRRARSARKVRTNSAPLSWDQTDSEPVEPVSTPTQHHVPS